MKNTLLKLLAVTICTVSALGDPMRAYAASLSERYLSDIKLCIGQDYASSKALLSADGYKVLSTNLNATLEQPVYLGYKETTNPADAITGLSVMNMSGNYSFAEYEALLKRYENTVDETIADLVPAIEEYRKNYQKKTKAAVFCHDTLNQIVEDMDDNNIRGMGDYLLSCDLVKRNELRDVFMKGNTQIVLIIQEILALASDTAEDSWITRLTETTYDDLEEQYLDKYLHPSIAESKMDVDFGNGAEQILEVWDTFYSMLQSVENDLLSEEKGDNGETCYDLSKELEIAANSLEEDATQEEIESAQAWTQSQLVGNIAIYEYLNDIDYDGGTLLDFFNRPAEEIETYELYPLAAALSEAQIAQIDVTGLYQLFNAAIGKDYLDTEGVKKLQDMLKEIESISIYDGVEMGLFGNSVALTSAATAHNNASEDKWQDALICSKNNSERGSWKIWAFYLGVTTSFLAVGTALHFCAEKLESVLVQGTVKKAVQLNQVPLIYNKIGVYSGVKDFFFKMFTFKHSISPFVNFVFMLRTVCFIVSIVMFVSTIAKLVETIIANSQSIDYEKIPNLIVDYDEETVNGDVQFKDLITYHAVEALDGREGDLNGFCSHGGWLMLYYTKDPKAGKPIQSSLKTVVGSSNAPSGYESVSLFNKSTAVNLTSNEYTNESDSVKGTYLYFKRSISTLTGSTFTGGTAAIVGGLSALAGIGLGAFFGSRLKKKKEQPA